MPPRHHRTVDRTVAIMEEASRASNGVSLAELAQRLKAPKTSIQELTNGLLATGYLVERDRRFLLGPGAYVLSLATAGGPLREVKHEELERAQERVGMTLFLGTRVGDDHVFVDRAGEDVLMDFVSATRPRRPLLITATGKVILSYMPQAERNEFLRRKEDEEPEVVAAFLEELPEIRERRLAFNRARTVPGRYAVASPLLGPDGAYVATLCAVGPTEVEQILDEVGARLIAAVDQWRWPRHRRRTGAY
jgi:DNA-binding IclR family transcriptional regulator